MPVRAIKRLKTELLAMDVPQAIVESFIDSRTSTVMLSRQDRESFTTKLPEMYVPQAIVESFRESTVFEILVQRHFDKNGKVLRTIGEQMICKCGVTFSRPFLTLAHHPLVRKYGVLKNEYLECIYQNTIHERAVGLIFKKIIQERIAIFPEREVEENSDIPSEYRH